MLDEKMDPDRKSSVETWNEAIEKAAQTVENFDSSKVAESWRASFQDSIKIVAEKIRMQRIAVVIPYVPLQGAISMNKDGTWSCK